CRGLFHGARIVAEAVAGQEGDGRLLSTFHDRSFCLRRTVRLEDRAPRRRRGCCLLPEDRRKDPESATRQLAPLADLPAKPPGEQSEQPAAADAKLAAAEFRDTPFGG